MPPETRSKRAPSSRVYSSSPALHQTRFAPPKRKARTVTYGKKNTAAQAELRNLRQQTITQIDYLQPLHPDDIDDALVGNATDIEDDDHCDEDRERAGDERARKRRRKTEGDAPDSTPSSSFHTQTLTQFYGDSFLKRDRTIRDSEDEDDEPLEDFFAGETTAESPKGKADRVAELRGTKSPSVIPQTPLKKRVVEIPSSQPSPCTPMLLRYSPLAPRGSPLKNRSTNVGSPLPRAGKLERKLTRTLTVQDSFVSAVSIPSDPSQASVKSTSQGVGGRSSQRTSANSALQTMVEIDESGDEEDGAALKENIVASEEGASALEEPESQERRALRPIEIPDSENEEDHDDDGGVEDYTPRQPAKAPTIHFSIPSDAAESDKENVPVQEEDKDDPYGIGEETQVAMDILASSEEAGLTPRGTNPFFSNRQSTATTPIPSSRPVEETPRPRQKKAVGFSSPQVCLEDEERSAAQHKTQAYTQMGSQRVDLAIFDSMAPVTDRSDVFISMHPEHVANILDGTKDHEFRTWKMPTMVSRVWIYVTKPESQLRYMACIGPAKEPGEVEDESGVGNAEFNKGEMGANYAHEILQVYELNNPFSLGKLRENGWMKSPPQKYMFAPPVAVSNMRANLRCQLLVGGDNGDDLEDEEEEFGDSVPDSQHKTPTQEEVEAQLLEDMAQATQRLETDRHESLTLPSQRPPVASGRRTTRASQGSAAAARTPMTTLSPRFPGSRPSTGRRRSVVIPASQATTASESSSPGNSPPKHSVPRPVEPGSSLPVFHDGGSPVRVPEGDFGLRSSQLVPVSQLFSETLMRDDGCVPPPGYNFEDEDEED